MTIDPGTTLSDRWELTALIASGGMGDVYRARDEALDRDVAVKVLRRDVVDGHRRFEREIEMLSNLEHPNIVAMLDVGEHEEQPYLVMELVNGPALKAVLADGPLDLEATRRMGAEIASALAYAHDRDIIHRDVKPSNVLFDADGSAKLADFGIARLADLTGLTTSGAAVGTASYVAPEQLDDQEDVGPESDVYVLGLVLLEAITGERAFRGTPTEAALARLHRDPGIPDDVPEPWRRVVRAMTARQADERPSAAEVADLLEAGPSLGRTEALQTPRRQDPAADGSTRPLPTGRGGAALTDRLRRWGLYLAVALIALAAFLVLVVPALDDDAPGDVTEPPATDLPTELDSAFERLLRSVQP